MWMKHLLRKREFLCESFFGVPIDYNFFEVLELDVGTSIELLGWQTNGLVPPSV